MRMAFAAALLWGGLAARRASRAIFPATVTEYPASSSSLVAFAFVAPVSAPLNGDLGPSAP